MYSFYILLILALIITIYGIIEFFYHQRRIRSIPIRIHVNGTRGKSSVTRLIAAGLRAGGISTIAKVTGTFPRLILEDGSELHIHRRASPNIIEQLSIAKFTASRKIKAFVVECMALQPQNQWITENQMIHATVGVITNIRLDHVDIMGYTLPEIAEVLGKSIPKKQHVFTAENAIPHILEKLAEKKKAIVHFSDPASVSTGEIKGFSYMEHPENIALALSVCEHLGIEKKIALQGMINASYDPGALTRNEVEVFNKKIAFYNAFAANDPESTLIVWQKLLEEIGSEGIRIVILNTRQDRLDRARQLAELSGKNLAHEIDYLILIGQCTDAVENLTIKKGMDQQKIINLGWTTPALVFEKVLSVTEEKSTVFAIGNMGGMGAPLAEYFENRSGHYND